MTNPERRDFLRITGVAALGSTVAARNPEAEPGGTARMRSQSATGSLSYPQSEAERAAGVTPINYAYPPCNALRYGAVGDDSTDNVSALTSWLASAERSNGGSLVLPPGVYRITSGITSSRAEIRINGDKGAEIKMVGGGFIGLELTGDHAEVDGVRFTSTIAPGTPGYVPVALRFADASYAAVTRCHFERLCVNARCNHATAEHDFRFTDNKVTGDWNGWSNTDAQNVIDIRGVQNIIVSRNMFDCGNFEKLVKVSSALTQSTLPVDDAYRCKRFLFTGNIVDVECTAGVTLVDWFAGTDAVNVIGNLIEVRGTFAQLITTKPSGGGVHSPYAGKINISGNDIVTGTHVEYVIKIFGAWGLPWFSGQQICNISSNTITHANASAEATIVACGYNVACIHGNVVERASATNARFVQAYNNQLLNIYGNSTTFGAIDIAGNGNTPNAESYANQPQSIAVIDNMVDDHNLQAPVIISKITNCEEITIADNHLRNQTDTKAVQGAVYFNEVSGVQYLNIHDNRANCANRGKNGVCGSPAVTARVEHDNSWNSATAAYDPGKLVHGASKISDSIPITNLAPGDWVRAAAPYDLEGISVNAYCSAPAVARIHVHNQSGGTRNLAGGAWRLTWGKG